MRVKAGKGARATLDKKLDGWQLGLAIVLMAWALVMIIVPRPASPVEVPAPTVGPNEIAELRRVETTREAAARAGLPPAVRALGSAVRAFGRAERARDQTGMAGAKQDVAIAAAALVGEPVENILALRALQTASFVTAVRAYEASGTTSRDMDELGGGLLAAFQEAGFAHDADGRTKVTMDDDELGAAFRKRWNELVSLRREVAAPSLTEEKLLFAHALRHMRSARAGRGAFAGSRSLLRRIDEYARLDPTYPADFARGVAYFAAGAYVEAQVAFDRHLAAHPDGALALRAQSFGRASLLADAEGVVP